MRTTQQVEKLASVNGTHQITQGVLVVLVGLLRVPIVVIQDRLVSNPSYIQRLKAFQLKVDVQFFPSCRHLK
jgi:hypothetical protein